MKNILKLIAIMLNLVIINLAHAGFVTGVVVGSVLSSSNKSDTEQLIITSDKYDVITCCRHDEVGMKCSISNYQPSITTTQFANQNGYKTVYKISYLSRSEKCDIIIMEVGK
jgi:hypothetical protein